MPRFDCVCVGLTTVDVLALHAGELREDEKIPAERIAVDGGGPAGTCAAVLGRCGLRTAVLSFIGQDAWTGLVLGQLEAMGVSTGLVQAVRGMATPVSLVAVSRRNASRTILWNSQGAGRRRVPMARLLRGGALDTACLHSDGHLMDLSLRLAAAARRAGILVSYDCGSVKPGWERLAGLADVFIASHKFTRQLGMAIPAAIRALRARHGFQVAVTAGEKGCYYYDEARGKVGFLRQRPYAAVDTTGCGDVFHGAFLARYLGRRDFLGALGFAQETAGLKTLELGGRAGIPSRSWLRRRL
ncbi:MAG: hypothetical protein HY927_07800 [Elusimicrobia bacterium]|nr:hypothetical protein [Elusimicrobiota bacterium]